MSNWWTNVVAVVAAMLWIGSGTAEAYSAEYQAWHNGSKMLISLDEDAVVISYTQPKSSLRKHGVTSGTVLFSGNIDGKRVEGDASVFRSGCEPAEYWVTGNIDFDTGRLVLRGDAPRRASGGCDVVGYSGESSNARLVFEFTGSGDTATPPPGGGEKDFCGWWAIYSCHKSRSPAVRDMNDAGYGKVIHTNEVPNFRNGYFCLVNGPLSGGRSEAQDLADRARPDFSSSYIKQGCK